MNLKVTIYTLCVITFSCLLACGQSANNEPTFFAEENPEKLSDWGILQFKKNTLSATDQNQVYKIRTALFSDYAHKLRTIWMPDNQSAIENSDGTFEFPVGTVISKTFYYPKAEGALLSLSDQSTDATNDIPLKNHKLIETRLLVKRASGWVGLPYIWNTEQTEATLQRFGEIIKVQGVLDNNEQKSFNYLVPDVNQCAGCHQWDKTKDLQPIGPQVRHLQTTSQFAGHTKFIDSMTEQHTSNAIQPTVNNHDIQIQARQYLDINCSHCHNPTGPGNTSGLHLEAFRELSSAVGICKLPIAAGAGTGDREYDIYPGQPDNSIISYRMNSDKPDIMMPELGRSLIHKEGVEIINHWISSLKGKC